MLPILLLWSGTQLNSSNKIENNNVLMFYIFVINLSNSFLKLEEELFWFLAVKSYCTSINSSSCTVARPLEQ